MKPRQFSVFNSALFYTGTSILAKVGGFVVQFVLGWLLTKNDYGTFAIALSISAVASCLVNGGTDKVIIQRGNEYEKLAPRIATFSIFFNLAIFCLVAALSGSAANYYNNEALEVLLVVLAAGFLLATPGPILVARLAVQKRFRELALINLVSVLIKHGLTILLALLGAAALSLVLPLAMQPLIAAVLLYRTVKIWPGFASIRNVGFRDILRNSSWVIGSNFSFQLANNLQYFLLGMYFNPSMVGLYFFAIQLVNSPIALIDNTVKNVLFPSLSGAHEDKERFRRAVEKSIEVALSMAAILAVVGYFLLPPLMNFIWQGKWDDAAVYAQLMCMVLPSLVLRNAIYEIVASAGLWRARFLMLSAAIIVEIAAIELAIGSGVIYLVVLSLLLFRTVFVIFLAFYAMRRIGGFGRRGGLSRLFIPYCSWVVGLLILGATDGFPYKEQVAGVTGVLLVSYHYAILNRNMLLNQKLKRYLPASE